MISSQLLTIGEVSRRSGIAHSALRFYEERGLVFSQRTEGNQRRYDRGTLRRIGIIRAAQSLGIPLKEIKHALDSLPNKRTPTQRDWERMAGRWSTELDRRIARLEYLQRKLASCIQCGCVSIDGCALYNPGDVAAAKGPGAPGLPPL